MNVGLVEIALLVLVTIVIAVSVKLTKRRWLVVMPLFFLVAALVSPADVFSTLLIALPNCVLFALALKQFAGDSSRPVEPTA